MYAAAFHYPDLAVNKVDFICSPGSYIYIYTYNSTLRYTAEIGTWYATMQQIYERSMDMQHLYERCMDMQYL